LSFYERLTQPILNSGVDDLLERLPLLMQNPLDSARLENKDITDVLLIGSVIPFAQERITDFFEGRVNLLSHSPKDAMAIGGARIAKMISAGETIEDVSEAMGRLRDTGKTPTAIGVRLRGETTMVCSYTTLA
jgi:molecular chaperone DnaK (HSP70)